MSEPSELDELKEYLGARYDERRLRGHQRAVEQELEEFGDERRLYRESQAYLYDLTVFALSETKAPYRAALATAIPAPARVLDYGCGIGSDGIRLIGEGYAVAFADFDNPSVEYLRWRLRRRGLACEIFDLDVPSDIPSGFDLAYAFDVIEHVDDPFSFLGRMESLARHVMVNFLEPDPDETSLHHALPLRGLLRHVARHRVLHYGVYHGRSHLVLYESAPGSWAQRVRSRLRLAARGRFA
jgi:2-polyprenyl-3-methyl-5-hydroxy-6-metoxy-1,4-benzoquinol methylase